MLAAPALRPTILVVDLDEAVRSQFYRTFKRAGFKVVLASSGEAAVRLYGGVQASVAVVLVSGQRPGLNARRVLAALQEINSDVRCVIATALTPEEELLPLVRQGAVGLLAKPLDLNDALRLVRRVVEDDPAREGVSPRSSGMTTTG
jgi:DNA-binding NtrC family response regulator